jgi:hypothetical protein
VLGRPHATYSWPAFGGVLLAACSETAASTQAADASTDAIADAADASSAPCRERQPHCGACDDGDWARCVAGAWSCNGAPDPSFFQYGCECYDATLDAGGPGVPLACCMPDGGSVGQPDCLADGGGSYSAGTLVCSSGTVCSR